MLFVASAGNNAQNTDVTPQYPADYDVPNVVSVAATTPNDELATYSNYGASTVDLGAPGDNIYSTYPANAYRWISGTSPAAAVVSGVAALVLSECDVTTSVLKDMSPHYVQRFLDHPN